METLSFCGTNLNESSLSINLKVNLKNVTSFIQYDRIGEIGKNHLYFEFSPII